MLVYEVSVCPTCSLYIGVAYWAFVLQARNTVGGEVAGWCPVDEILAREDANHEV
jgi:hypothetical protein